MEWSNLIENKGKHFTLKHQQVVWLIINRSTQDFLYTFKGKCSNIWLVYIYRFVVFMILLTQFLGLSKLNTLSLSHTAVTNKTLALIGNSAQTGFTRDLKTLNLSHCTAITDRGVRSLNGKTWFHTHMKWP